MEREKKEKYSVNHTKVLYLPPGGDSLAEYDFNELPSIKSGVTRVVCISDTHNEHNTLNLPWGHLLVHSGDVFTESGVRHINRKSDSVFVTVKPAGVSLLESFGTWLGKQPHPHKMVIGGNHDWVFQSLGAEAVQRSLAEYCGDSFIYLDHEEASVGPVNVFGSPYGNWGSRNDAFKSENIEYDFCKETHIFATHYPPILPKESTGTRESHDMVACLIRSDCLLQVSGHCHWAHGLYFPKKKKVPCVVASVCDSKFLNPVQLLFAKGGRGDTSDKYYGGYNVYFPPIVCDLLIPGGPPKATDQWVRKSRMRKPALVQPFVNHEMAPSKPKILFFGPPTDPDAVKRLVPAFSTYFEVSHFDDVDEALIAIGKGETFDVCIGKLGSRTNNCWDLFETLCGKTNVGLLNTNANPTILILHSTTAMRSAKTKDEYTKHFGVQMFVDQGCEKELLKYLEEFAGTWHLVKK